MSAEPIIIRHHREEAYAVTFQRNGRAYRTSFTRRRGEAEIWAHSVRVYGWSVSGRPYPVHPDDIIQTVEGTA